MTQPKKVIVMGSFKTGTSSLFSLLKNSNSNIKVLSGKHNRRLKKIDFDLLVIPVRKHYEIFMSAYFQDITKLSYEYGYHESKDVILNEKCENLISHFLKFDWKKYDHLSPYTSINFFRLITKKEEHERINKIKLNNNEMFYIGEFSNKFTNKKFKVLIIGYCYLSFQKIQNIFKQLDISITKNFHHSNDGNKKWYSKKYIEFKENLKDYKEYFKKYKELDHGLFENIVKE